MSPNVSLWDDHLGQMRRKRFEMLTVQEWRDVIVRAAPSASLSPLVSTLLGSLGADMEPQRL